MTQLPLHGIKILDLSRVLAGPYCAQILGDLGAEITKIEDPSGGDETRKWTPPEFDGQSTYFLSANRNKISKRLNFNSKEDLSKIHRHISTSDIVIENFKIGSLEKFGLDYESLKEKYPRLIYCSITGFGKDGPYAKLPGYDLLIQGLGGMMSITGPNALTPTKSGVAIIDLCTGLYACIGILAALREREISGKGQFIDLSLLDVSVSLLSYVAMNFLATHKIPEPIGNTHPTIVPYQAFNTKDRPLLICVGSDHQFENFCHAIETEWNKETRFVSNEQRCIHRHELATLIENKLKQKSREEWLKIFDGKGFPVGPINNLKEVSEDPQVIHRKLFTTMSDGITPCIASPLRFSRTPISVYSRPPR